MELCLVCNHQCCCGFTLTVPFQQKLSALRVLLHHTGYSCILGITRRREVQQIWSRREYLYRLPGTLLLSLTRHKPRSERNRDAKRDQSTGASAGHPVQQMQRNVLGYSHSGFVINAKERLSLILIPG